MRTGTRPPRVVFVSAHEFGLRALMGMVKSSAARAGDILFALIVTVKHPETVATVGMQSLDAIADAIGAPHGFATSVKASGVAEMVRAAKPDFLMAVGLSELLPPSLLNIPAQLRNAQDRHSPRHGAIGMHPTLLPIGRGRAPIPWTIIKNLERSGVTAFRLEESPDAGDIITVAGYSIDHRETALSLFEKAASAHEEIGHRLAELVAAGAVTAKPQDETLATEWPLRRPGDGQIDFSESAEQIDRLVRAQAHPYPGAYMVYNDARIIVDAVEYLSIGQVAPPGRVVFVDNAGQPTIACSDGLIFLKRARSQSPVEFQTGSSAA